MALSSKYTKGIEIEISGKTSKLKTALDEANRSIRSTQSELKTLQKGLELEWNADNFKRAQELSQRVIQQTASKAEMLKKALAELDKQGEGKDTEKYEAIRRELTYVQASASKAEAQLKKLNELQFKNLTDGLNAAAVRLDSLGNKLTVGLTAPLAAAGTASVNFASDTEEAVNKVEVAFKGAADGVKSWSDTTLTSIGLAKGTALDMAALYGDMATSMGFADGQAAEMSKTLVNLAADLSSFKNISIDMSNTALKSIFTGETESLKGLGIVMTQTNLEAYAMAQGFQTAYKDMDQAQQVAVRYQYVLDQTKNAQGDFSRTFDGTANQLRVFQESLKEAAATAGEELLPVITPIVSNLSELVQSFGDLDEGTRKAVVQTGLFLAALGPMLKLTGGVTSAVNAGVTAYNALKTATAGATAAQTGLNVAMSANPVGAVVTAVGSLVAVLGTLALTSALMSDRTDDLNKRLKESAKAYEEKRAAIREENGDTLAAVSTLEVLASTEQKTAAQKAALSELVDELNETVPGLTLAYDAQTDSLNMTTEALRGLIEAEAQRQLQEEAVGRMVELKKDEARITAELTEAQTGLARAEAEMVSIAAQYEKLGGESYAERHVSAYRTASAEAGRYRSQIETLTGTLEDTKRETAGVEEEYRTYSAAASQAAGASEGLAEQTEAVGTAAAGTGEKVSELASSLDSAAKSYNDVTDAEAVGVSTAIKLQEEYAKLVDENADLLEQHPELYAALDANNTVQENSAEIAKSVWGIRRQLLIDELEAQADNIRAQIENLNTLKDTALDTYSSMAKAALLANGGAAMARANQLLGVEAESTSPMGPVKQDVEETSAAARDLQNQLNGVLSQIESLRNTNVNDYVVGSVSGKSSKSGSKKEKDAAMEALQEWLSEMDHQIYLWGKEGGREAAIAGAYRDMQEAVHKLAEEYRGKGYDETSEEIQKLQKLWWGYADALEKQNQDAYGRELSALEEALGNEEITTGEYLERRSALQTKYLTEGSAAWEAAEKERQARAKQLNEAAYDEELDDLKYYRDMDMITEEQFYLELAELRDKYLEENSDKWRSATVELHNYLEQCREEELEAAKKAYEKQLKDLDDALDDRLDAVKTAYNDEVEAIKAAYSEETAALKKKFSEEKTALKEGYDQAKTAAKDAYDAQKEAAKAAYEEKKKAVQDELKLEKDRLNAVLEGIDAEIQARRELREDEDLDAKIAAARKRLENARTQREYARTDEDRAEWDKEIVRLQEALDKAVRDKEDTEFYRQKEEEKEAVREQIGAAEEKADAALEGLKTEYDAQVKELDAAYKVKVRELEAEYKASLSALEQRQEAELAAAKEAYEKNLAQAKADYERRVEEAQRDYERDKSRLEDRLSQAEDRINGKYDKGSQGGGREYSDVVHAIAKENDVSLDIAQDMYEANQRNEGNPDLPHYSDGGYSAGKAVAAAAGAIGAAVAGMVTSVGRTVENNVRNSANVTINQASSLTEGQVARTVRKVLDEMGR